MIPTSSSGSFPTTVDTLQDFAVDVRFTAFGQGTVLQWAFPGLTRPPQSDGDHIPSFQKGIRRANTSALSVRPHAQRHLLPRGEERGQMLREHARKGTSLEVLTNNVQGFGIGDYEWILAFGADQI